MIYNISSIRTSEFTKILTSKMLTEVSSSRLSACFGQICLIKLLGLAVITCIFLLLSTAIITANSMAQSQIPSCQDAKSCDQLINSLRRSVSTDIRTAVSGNKLTICYPSMLVNVDQKQQQQKLSKLSKRFQLTKKPGTGDICFECTKEGGPCKNYLPVTWLGMELFWRNGQVTMRASIVEREIIITDIVADGYSNRIDLFVKMLFNGSSDDCIAAALKNSTQEIEEEMAIGAFLDDLAGLLTVKLDLRLAMDRIEQETEYGNADNQQKMQFYLKHTFGSDDREDEAKLLARECEQSMAKWNNNIHTTNKYDINLCNQKERIDHMKACIVSINERNRRFGYEKSSSELCWMTDEEEEENFPTGALISPFPNGTNYEHSPNVGPPVPTPERSQQEQRARMNHSKVDPREFGIEPPSKKQRAKRQLDNSIDDPLCDRWETDARAIFPQCKDIIGYIRDQGKCSNCYAVSTAAALTDRACIKAKKKFKAATEADNSPFDYNSYRHRVVSARDVMECYNGHQSNGCYGGHAHKVWEYFFNEGGVNELCKPYTTCDTVREGWKKKCFSGCDSKMEDNGSLDLIKWGTGFDKNSYDGDRSLEKWKIDKNFAAGLYRATEYIRVTGSEWMQRMMVEIETNGTIVASMQTYKDLPKQTKNKRIYRADKIGDPGRHSVRIIGFGEIECFGKTDKYWIVANSWGLNANNDGIFYIARGEDECGIESSGVSWGDVFLTF